MLPASPTPQFRHFPVPLVQTWSTAAGPVAEPSRRRGRRGDLFQITSNNGFALNAWLHFVFFLLHFSQPWSFFKGQQA